ncbi:MAG: DUF3842 family protein [Clostridiales bacterium]|jgi:NAD(P)-dependent dehydrogenase (short-subunit alcohol dehydrogenase family)|nr:DUF3842 family protein [Clostridiales bacterium]
MRIAVIDGQGGGIGKAIIEMLRAELGDDLSILALGTNALATSQMLRAGANEGATGENAIVFNAPKADVVIGSIAIVAANSMLGELTPAMARAVAESPAKKVLIPLNRCNLYVMGVGSEPLPHHISHAVHFVKSLIRGEENV